MNFIHKNELIHRDLKIENIMVNSVFESKLVDVGLARINDINSQDTLKKGVGILNCMSKGMIKSKII